MKANLIVKSAAMAALLGVGLLGATTEASASCCCHHKKHHARRVVVKPVAVVQVLPAISAPSYTVTYAYSNSSPFLNSFGGFFPTLGW